MGRISIMLNVGSSAKNKCLVVVVEVVVEVLVDVVVVVVVVVVDVVVVVAFVVNVLVAVAIVDLVEEERPHLALQGQHLPVRRLTHLFFLGWYLHALKC